MNQLAWKTSNRPREFMALVRNPKRPSWTSSQRPSAAASPRTAAGTCGTTTPIRLASARKVMMPIAQRTLVNSRQLARKGSSSRASRDDLQPFVLVAVVGGDELRHLLAAGGAPGGPEIDDHRFATEVAQAEVAAVQLHQQEVRGQAPLLRLHLHPGWHERSRHLHRPEAGVVRGHAGVGPVVEPPDGAGDGADHHER